LSKRAAGYDQPVDHTERGLAGPFQWGIVGTGGIARQFAADLSHLPEASLAGVCSRDIDKAKAFQSAFGAGRAYANLDAMAADPDIAAVYIATPNALHAEQALQAIAHGKAVLVEKPLATSAADAERIAAAAARQKCFAMEAMWTRFLPAVRAVRKLIDGGAIGQIRRIEAELSYRHDEDNDSRFFSRSLGGGAALDLGVYPVSLALLFLGKPRKISGSWQASKSGVDIRTSIDLQFAGGAEARLSCGFDRNGANAFTIEGSEGVLRLETPFLKAQRLARFTPKAFAMIPNDAGSGIAAKILRRLPLPGRGVQNFAFPGNGLQFEAAAVMDAVRRGATGSETMPLADSIEVLRIVATVLSGSPQARSDQNVL
jgi:predicted dehydrogenase